MFIHMTASECNKPVNGLTNDPRKPEKNAISVYKRRIMKGCGTDFVSYKRDPADQMENQLKSVRRKKQSFWIAVFKLDNFIRNSWNPLKYHCFYDSLQGKEQYSDKGNALFQKCVIPGKIQKCRMRQKSLHENSWYFFNNSLFSAFQTTILQKLLAILRIIEHNNISLPVYLTKPKKKKGKTCLI